MKHLLLFICFWAIHTTSIVRASDGCKAPFQIRCGDKCGDVCSCGNHSFNNGDQTSWCCTNDTCTVTLDERDGTLVTCQKGSQKSLSSPCNGRCNHWIKDTHRAGRSYVLCLSEKQCVNERDMCRGDALCDDQSDLSLCRNKTMWSGKPCQFDWIENRCKGSIPGQCIDNAKLGDGEYNCNDRSDEKPHETHNESVLNMTALRDCYRGLYCGEECVSYYAWCNTIETLFDNNICPELNNVTITDKELCSNVTFWETRECGSYDGAVGVRCTGKRSGQCIYPNSSSLLYPRSRSCDDRSDQKHQINGTCPPIDHTRNTACLYVCKFGIESDCNECLNSDPHNCSGSCNSPGPSCDSCTNPSYFYCNRSGECVHPDLRCDLHPQCHYGEDEENCLEKYREKDLVPQHATYKCQSPYYHDKKNIAKKISIDETSGKQITVDIEYSGQYVNVKDEEKSVVVEIVAVRCNQVRECYNNVDEDGCDNDISPVKVLLALFSLSAASFALSICLRYCKYKFEDQESQVESTELEGTDRNAISLFDQIQHTDITNENDLNRIKYIIEDKHTQSYGFEEVNMSLTTLQNMNVTQEFKKGLNSFYFAVEMEIHKGNKAETLVCMKQHLNPDIAEIILNDAEPDSQVALLRWCKTKSGAAKEFFKKGDSIWNFLKMTKKIVSLYLDITKDIALTVSLLAVITFDSVIDYPTFFSCQIIWLLIFSILVPLLTFGIQVASRTPYIIFGMEGQKKYQKSPMGAGKLMLLRILIVVFALLVPALLIYIEERTKEDARNVINEGKTTEKIIKKFEEKIKFAFDVSRLILEYKRNEFSFEIIIQITIQIMMLLMNYTNTKTTSGLEVIFKETLQSEPSGTIDRLDYEIKKSLGTTNILVLSILWSFKTTVTTYNKIKSIEKGGFFPTKAKLVLGVRTLICTITRVGCIVVYFSPFLGLFDLMGHWKSEQISFSPFKDTYYPKSEQIIFSLLKDTYYPINMTHDTLTCWNDDLQEVENVPYSQLYRSDYHNGTRPATPPSYISYTMMKLDMAYLIFWIIMFSQMILLLCSKLYLNRTFRAGRRTYQIRHILQTLHVPDTASDWDEIEGSAMAQRRQWRKTILEISIMILIQFIVNLSLLWPIFVLGFKIRERHEFIKPCIGVLPEEDFSYQRVSNFMWSLPGFVFLSSFLDWLLVFIYQKKCHPWVGILKDEQIVEVLVHSDHQTVVVSHNTASANSYKDHTELHTNVEVVTEDPVQEVNTRVPVQEEPLTAHDDLPNKVCDSFVDPAILCKELIQHLIDKMEFSENGDYLNFGDCHDVNSNEDHQHPQTNHVEVATIDTREPIQEESLTSDDDLPNEEFAEDKDDPNLSDCHDANSYEDDENSQPNAEVGTKESVQKVNTTEPVQEEPLIADDDLPNKVCDTFVDPAILCKELIQHLIDKMEVS